MIKNKIICINIILILILMLFSPYGEVFASSTYTQYVTSGIESFPTEYQTLLNELVESTGHTNWTFKAYYTGIDWNDYVAAQSVCGKNRVYYSFDTAYRCSCGDCASSYYCANSSITSYYMDPTNFINERNIFQFLEMSYDESIQTQEIVHSLVSKYAVFNYGNAITFIMSDENHPNYGQAVTMTFTDIIMEAAIQSQMSPISIAIKIVQEVGSSGSESVSGTNTTYPNTYNYFNIGATDSGDAILNGLSYASSKGWNCPYTSIVEGAIYNSTNYVQAGQNTSYFYKFDCVGSSILNVGQSQTVADSELFSHQYMTNIQDPYSQSISLFTTYTNYGLLNQNLCFVIPIFDNMPETVSKPSSLSSSTGDLYYANISSTVSTRESPTTSSNIVMYLYRDDLVLMLEKNCATANGYTWDKVQLWNGQIAYVVSMYLEPYEKSSSSDGTTGDTTTGYDKVLPSIGYGYANVSSSLNIRSGPATTYTKVGTLYSYDEATILSQTDSWYQIYTSSGITGYVSKDYFVTVNYYSIEGTTINVISNINANIIAGIFGVEEYIIKSGETVLSGNTIGTGNTLEIAGTTYTIVKKGDCNGDGTVSTVDYMYTKNVIMNTDYFNEYQISAVDLNKDSIISTADYMYIKNIIMNRDIANL